MLRLPFNLGIGGAVQTGFRYAYEHDYDVAVRVDGDGQHDPAQLGTDPRAGARTATRTSSVGSRFAARTKAAGYRSSRSRRVGIRDARVGRLAHRRAAGHRHDLGLPGAESQGYRAVRARLPARLSRGRGDGDGVPPPAASGRGAGDDARARRRPLFDHRRPLGLLHDQGAARDLRRAVPQGSRCRRRARHDTTRRLRRGSARIVRAFARRARADPQPAAARALRTALARDRHRRSPCCPRGATG